MRSISRKAAAWASGAVIAVGGGTAGIVLAVGGGGGTAGAGHALRARAVKTAPLREVSVSPAAGARSVDGTAAITVTYNQPLPAGAPLPRLSPAVPGTWLRAGDTAVFTPAAGFPARTRVRVMVAAGDGPTRSMSSSSFTTGSYRTLGLQELLAQLGYLPLTWTAPARPGAPSRGASQAWAAIPAQPTPAPRTTRDVLSELYAPPAGTFRWEAGYPARLRSFWSAGKANTIQQGAVTAFEADHGLPTDGTPGPALWKALLKATAAGQRNSHGYSYAVASQHIPETLTIWHDGREVFRSYANTGISVAPTPVGTFPVYEKLPYQVMQGSNPDGSHYADPVWWVSYFNGGSAVHYIGRGSYGYPQSLGCVELPYTAAKDAYPYLPYGTLVTVTP